jgi:transcriptional regulator with XRE-family HTH domain
MFNESDALGPALRLLRQRRLFRQYQVAEKAGITKAMLSSYETGKSTPSLKTLNSILRAMESGFAEFQWAFESLCGKRPPEELAPFGGGPAPSWSDEEARAEVIEFLAAKLGALEGVLKRIADSIQIVVSAGMPPPQEPQAGMRRKPKS